MLVPTNNQIQHSKRHPAPACPGLAPNHLSIYQPFFEAILRPTKPRSKLPIYTNTCQNFRHPDQNPDTLLFDTYSPSRFASLIKINNPKPNSPPSTYLPILPWSQPTSHNPEFNLTINPQSPRKHTHQHITCSALSFGCSTLNFSDVFIHKTRLSHCPLALLGYL